ncbi:hypothetical protein AB4Z17_32695, partial [Paenibacillus sp. TAF43_2]|uniref:hypothetical protein n=1 Tax=Paenibacillus sp. TAF43_2 TaxID=3233069 RepID=UPI003F9869F5
MKQYKKFLLLMLVLTIVLIGAGSVFANEQFGRIFVPKEDAEAYIDQQLKLNNKDITYTQRNNNSNEAKPFYDDLYSGATKEQRVILDKLIEDKSMGLPGEWKRSALIAVGKLSSKTPRITLQEAERLREKYEGSKQFSSDVVAEFNKIAGAPDWEGGSGIPRSVYYLNDERSESIYVIFDRVLHVITNEKGEETVKPIGEQTVQVIPEPSSQVEKQSNLNANSVQAPNSTPSPVLS